MQITGKGTGAESAELLRDTSSLSLLPNGRALETRQLNRKNVQTEDFGLTISHQLEAMKQA